MRPLPTMASRGIVSSGRPSAIRPSVIHCSSVNTYFSCHQYCFRKKIMLLARKCQTSRVLLQFHMPVPVITDQRKMVFT